MKHLKLLVLSAIIIIGSSSIKNTPEFLYLNSEQLSSLGIIVKDEGVFYKNLNPNWNKDDGRYPGLMFYCNKDNYLTTIHFDEYELKELEKKSEYIIQMELTEKRFNPVLIGDTEGNMSLNTSIPGDQKLLPIAINLNDKTDNRKDIIVIWFKPSESIKKALPENIDIEVI